MKFFYLSGIVPEKNRQMRSLYEIEIVRRLIAGIGRSMQGKRLFLFLLFFFCGLTAGAQKVDTMAAALQSKMIWSGPDDGRSSYTVFRKTFNLTDFDAAAIYIFADARYMLWINGQEVLRGPCRFDPKAPSYDSDNVTSCLKEGKNTMVIMVMSHGSNSRMMNHEPGLTAGLEIRKSQRNRMIWTDTSWRWNDRTRYLPPVQGWGFVCDRIDARLDDGDWKRADYNDSGWNSAIPVDGSKWGTLSSRSIPLLAEHPMSWVPLSKNKLPVELKVGQSYIIRADKMIQGFPVIRFEAEAGIVIRFDYSYAGDSTHVDRSYNASSFYTAKEGVQEFIPTGSYGFRYLQISVLNGGMWSPYHMRINQIELVDRRYPYLEPGCFECNDTFLNDLWKRSALTMRVNCEDGYMDCALREKAEWMGDAALIEYPLSRSIFAIAGSNGVGCSDNGLIVSLLRHIAQSQNDSGMFKAHHPSDRFDIHAYIEDYSCLWVQALKEVYERTGNMDLVKELWNPLKKQMKWFENHRTSHGLVLGREFTFIDNPLAYCRCEGATLNAFIYRAFCDATFLAREIRDVEAEREYKRIAQELFQSYNKYLWMPSIKTYSSGLSGGKQMMPTAHAALLALNRGLVPENHKQEVKNYLFSHYRDKGNRYAMNGVIPDSFFDQDLQTQGIDMPYTAFWMLEELFKDGRDKEALSFIHDKWDRMMKDSITGTLWEAFNGGDICHNVGAVPAYFLSTRVLGVSERLPVSSGVIEIRPMLGNLTRAEGTVVTVHGPVFVKWEKQDNGLAFTIHIPGGTKAQVTLPYNKSCKTLLVNNKETAFHGNKNQLTFTIDTSETNGIYQ